MARAAASRTGIWTWIVRGLALIGVCTVAALVIGPTWFHHYKIERLAELRRKAPWPTVYRDCLTDGAQPLPDARFLDLANAAWLARLKDSTAAYQQQYAGHPSDLSRSAVQRLTTPQTPKAQQDSDLSPYEYDTRISAMDAARLGLRSYVIVHLPTGGVETEHLFRYDACGAKF